MSDLGLDLASKFSAAVLLDDGGQVTHQFDSWGLSPVEFCWTISTVMTDKGVDRIWIEDVPYGISNQAMVKPVLRLQGMLMHSLHRHGVLDRAYFVNPSVWQRHFTGVFRGGADGARAAAEERGYFAPNLLEQYSSDIPEKGPERSKVRAQLKKAATDYTDGFLIASWAQEAPDIYALKGVQPPHI